jgi:hypothetical protein
MVFSQMLGFVCDSVISNGRGGKYQIITFYIMIHSLFVFRYVPVVLDAIFFGGRWLL